MKDGPDTQALVRAAVSTVVRSQAERALGKWQFEAALFLLEDAVELGLHRQAIALGGALLAQDPGNERACVSLLRGHLGAGDAAGAAGTYRQFVTDAERCGRPGPSERLQMLALQELHEVYA